jgi:large subunit ribosomal protein L21
MSYAIISLGGKQYRVREGERLVVDRVAADEGKTFSPRVLFSGGDGRGRLAPEDVTVTVRVVGHVLGEKIRIGKYKPKSGYRRHTGYRSRLTQIEVESIGSGRRQAQAAKPEPEPAEKPKAAEKPAAAEKAKPVEKRETAEKPARLPEGLPTGYAEMTVTEVGEGAKSWTRPELDAALEYEQAHAGRKGALSALESALAKKEDQA